MNLNDAIAANPIGFGWLAGYLIAAGALIAFVWRLGLTWIQGLDIAAKQAAMDKRNGVTWRRNYTAGRTEPTWLIASMRDHAHTRRSGR